MEYFGNLFLPSVNLIGFVFFLKGKYHKIDFKKTLTRCHCELFESYIEFCSLGVNVNQINPKP